MRRLALLALIALLGAACGGSRDDKPAAVDERNEWSIVQPEEAGIDDARLQRLERRLVQEWPNLRSVLVARDGRLVLERYYGGAGPETRFEVYSVTKSVLSALVGIALADGKLHSVEQRVIQFFRQDVPQRVDPRLRRLTLDDLLTMRAGFSAEPIESSANWMRTLLRREFLLSPGTGFEYDGGSSHLLSGVLTEVTGKNAAALARERLFTPLGIEGWIWPDDGQGVSVGGDGLALRARDLAKFGQLYLQRGRWDGKRILDEDWVRESTRSHTGIGRPQRGYGYQWWVFDVPGAPGYAALGYGGQAVAVIPPLDLVVVITSLPTGDSDVSDVLYRVIVPVFAGR